MPSTRTTEPSRSAIRTVFPVRTSVRVAVAQCGRSRRDGDVLEMRAPSGGAGDTPGDEESSSPGVAAKEPVTDEPQPLATNTTTSIGTIRRTYFWAIEGHRSPLGCVRLGV